MRLLSPSWSVRKYPAYDGWGVLEGCCDRTVRCGRPVLLHLGQTADNLTYWSKSCRRHTRDGPALRRTQEHTAGRHGRKGTMRTTGVVKWFNAEKGYGFITPDDGGKDLFVHHSAIVGEGYKSLAESARVQFEAAQGEKGPEAKNVTLAPA